MATAPRSARPVRIQALDAGAGLGTQPREDPRVSGGLGAGGKGGASGAPRTGVKGTDLCSPDRYRAASNWRSIQAGALGGRFHSRVAGGTKGVGVSFLILTEKIPTGSKLHARTTLRPRSRTHVVPHGASAP